MKFACEIQTFATVKKGSRITLSLDDDATEIVLKGIQNYNKLPLICDLSVDIDERRQQLATISEDQRKKIYAIFNDIADSTGNITDVVKEAMKSMFVENSQHGEFSLSNCSRELAGDFIEFLIGWCFENGVQLADHPKEYFENVEDYLRLCINKKICCICGKPADIHHVDAVGQGRNRNKIDDSQMLKMALCREHHNEWHSVGGETFMAKYHAIGVLV